MTFHRTRDLDLIRSIILSDPRLYDAMSDDTCPPAEAFRLPEDPTQWYVLAKDGGELLGFWALIPKDESTAEVHTCLLYSAIGPRARRAAKYFLQWVWRETPFTRLVTSVPDYNRTALAFAERNGMRRFLTEEKKYPKRGVMHDLIHLELNKPETL